MMPTMTSVNRYAHTKTSLGDGSSGAAASRKQFQESGPRPGDVGHPAPPWQGAARGRHLRPPGPLLPSAGLWPPTETDPF